MKSVQGDSGHARMDMISNVYRHIIDEDRRFNAQRFEEQFYNAKGLKNVEGTPADTAPTFEAVEVLKPAEKVEPSEKETPKEDDAALIAKLLSNPEAKALLKALASSL